MSWPALKIKLVSNEEVRAHVQGLVYRNWRPGRIVLHNTAAPTQAQWAKTEASDRASGLVPGISRINSLEQFFRTNQHWSGAPHYFVDDDAVWVFNDPTKPGVHSPSWNNSSIGIEMIADFSKEDDDSGPGLMVRNNTIHLAALLCAELGIDPGTHVNLHKEDPATTHDCPGKDFAEDKAAVVASIKALMVGGEHKPDAIAMALGAKPMPAYREWNGAITTNGLNVREGGGVVFRALAALNKGAPVTVLGEVPNAQDRWLRVRYAADKIGWVSGKYVQAAKAA